MDDRKLDAIPDAAIQATLAFLPDPLNSPIFVQNVDVVSVMGLPCTVQFQLLPHNWPNTVWRWQAVELFRRDAKEKNAYFQKAFAKLPRKLP